MPRGWADFGEAIGIIGGVERKIHFFAFDLPHSDARFVVGYPAETTEAFCDGQVGAFAFFGGVRKSTLDDNTKIVVPSSSVTASGNARGCSPSCNRTICSRTGSADLAKATTRARSKGLSAMRRNFLVPIPVFESFAALNAHLLECCRRRMADCLRV